jgi:hypothetical protein
MRPHIWFFWFLFVSGKLAALKLLPSLYFLVDTGAKIELQTSVKSAKISILYPLNATEMQLSEALTGIRLLKRDFEEIAYLKGTALAKRFAVSMDLFKKSFQMIKHAYLYATKPDPKNPPPVLSPESDCVFVADMIQSFDLDFVEYLKENFKLIGKDWSLEQLKTDYSKYTTITNFIGLIESGASDWLDMVGSAVNEMDSMRAGAFPLSLKGKIERASCLDKINYETVILNGCDSGRTEYICEVEYRFPTLTVSYHKLETVNYGGIELVGKYAGIQYVREVDNSGLHKYNCGSKENLNRDVPVCKLVVEPKCTDALLANEVSTAVQKCSFDYAETEDIKVLEKTILAENAYSKVSEDGTKIFPAPTFPCAIYSNKKITVEVDGKSYEVSGYKNMEEKIETTAVSAANLLLLQVKVALQYQSYPRIIAIVLHFMQITSLIASIIIIVRYVKKQKRHLKKHISRSGKTCKTTRKENYTENKKLLKEIC